MISVTSKKSVNLDPINGQIWSRGPCINGFYYPKIISKLLESIWGHPGKILFGTMRIKSFENYGTCVCLAFQFRKLEILKS